MGQSLADAAVSGTKSDPTTAAKQKLLAAGDIDGLIALNRSLWGGLVMVKKTSQDDDSEDDGDDEDDEDGDDDEDDEDDDDDDEDPKDRRIKELSGESKKHRLKAREYRLEKERLQKENDELKKGKKGKTDDDSGEESEEVKTLRGDFDSLLGENEKLRIENAFLANNKHSWVNPRQALKLVDLDDVEIDDDGKVVGLDDALDELAKDSPHLLRKKGKDDEDDDEDDEAKTTRRRRTRTGQSTTTSKRGKGNASREALLKKYPALQR